MSAPLPQHSHRFRFAAAALLLLAIGLIATFAGYRYGYDRGNSWEHVPGDNGPIGPVTYDVGDLLEIGADGQPSFNTLIEGLKSIQLMTWDIVGGPGSIVGIGSDKLLIKQTPSVHEQIRYVLQSIRDGRNKQKLNAGRKPNE